MENNLAPSLIIDGFYSDDELSEDGINAEGTANIQRLLTEGNEEVEDLPDRSVKCYVCDETKIDFFYDCGNGLCRECIIGHVNSQLNKYKTKIFSDKIKMDCAGSCKCPVNTDHMLSLVDDATRAVYDELLLKMYLSKSKDILACPLSSCSNYGFFNKGCYCYECNACGHSWEEKFNDYSLINFHFNFSNFKFSNIRSIVKKFQSTKYCNKCESPIEKAEGCKHIECNRCDYSFCWRCTGDWSKHNEYTCMGLLTNPYDEQHKPELGIIVVCYVFVFLLMKIIFTLSWIYITLFYIFKIALFLGNIILDSFLVNYSLRCLKVYKSKITCVLILSSITILELILFYFDSHMFSEKWFFILDGIGLIVSMIYLKFLAK